MFWHGDEENQRRDVDENRHHAADVANYGVWREKEAIRDHFGSQLKSHRQHE